MWGNLRVPDDEEPVGRVEGQGVLLLGLAFGLYHLPALLLVALGPWRRRVPLPVSVGVFPATAGLYAGLLLWLAANLG